ncbi:unnamed protein product [Caenorhabditis auriculariae]|uniref:Uncharacterized protein n=1 Tax=Caenorhabditis auriculariae TaxID=2777116 RepID=A0A8S1H6I2_9PELO|nr:unnamed protein product [Caenorhabditis auriculariae]
MTCPARYSWEAKALDSFLWEKDGRDPTQPQDALRTILLIALFGLTFASSMVATFLRGDWARSHLLSFVSCIGGGVFLGACLLDLFPDAVESFEKTGIEIKFPLPYASVAVGFLLVLSIDQIAKSAREQGYLGAGARHHHLHSHDQETSSSLTDGEEPSEESQSRLGAVLLVLALSVHALFEGLSLAVTSDASQLLQIFAALIIHKCIMGFCLGVRLVQSGMSTPWLALCALSFSIQVSVSCRSKGKLLHFSVLIGGLAGIAIMRFIGGGEQKIASTVASILQAISCGTFLYITTFEVIPHELQKSNHRMLKLFFVFFGFFAIIAFLLVFPDAA